MAKAKYMHLLDNQPAFFDGDQICYAKQGISDKRLFVDSLDQIRREQRATIDYRAANSFGHEGFTYCYLRVTTVK